jgi:hypothetical protein
VVLGDQDLPLLSIAAHAMHDVLAPGLDANTGLGAPEGIGAGVDRVGQDAQDGVVDRRPPQNTVPSRAMDGRGQTDRFLPQPQQHLAHTAQFCELLEHHTQRLADTQVWIHLDAVRIGAHEADGHRRVQVATRGLQLERLDRTLPQQRQLHLRHRPLHAQQQPVIGAARIVDALFVDEETAHQRTELEQRMPVPTIACKPRCLDGDNRAHATTADRRQETLEARPSHTSGRDAKVVVNDDDFSPTKCAGTIRQRILAPPTLVVMLQLISRGLPNVDVGAARQVISVYLAHGFSPWLRLPLALEPLPIAGGRSGR